MSEKIEYLKELFDLYGDFELFYIKDFDPQTKRAISGWETWVKYSESSAKQKQQANLRSILKQEIVIDIENPSDYQPIIDQLKNLPITYLSFSTGSRGYHIHFIIPELKEKDINEVTLIKEQIIKYFGADISKKSERNLIALEYEPHFKTGNMKTLIEFESKKINNLDLVFASTIKLNEIKNNNPKFFDLFVNGSWEKWGYPSRSEAEASVCTILAQEGFRFEEIITVMDRCQIGKWQEKTDSYKIMTVNKALDYSKDHPKQIEQSIPIDDVFKFFEEFGIPKPVSWLVPEYIPAHGVVILAGPPGCGKSFITEEIISAISNRRLLFGSMNIQCERPIILIDMENDHSIIYERLTKLGGIPKEKLIVFNGLKYSFDINNVAYSKTLLDKVKSVNPGLIIFDTLRRTYSGNENDSETINKIYKEVLYPISQNCTVIMIAHTRKPSKENGEDKMASIRGTGDIAGLASTILMVNQDRDLSINLTVEKMRFAKQPKGFKILINEYENIIKLECINNVINMLRVTDLIEKDILEWLKENIKPGERIKFNEISNVLNKYKRRNIFYTVEILINRKILTKISKGLYIYNDVINDDADAIHANTHSLTNYY